MPHATRHMPYAICHMPHATRHMPHATCHMPHAMTRSRDARGGTRASRQDDSAVEVACPRCGLHCWRVVCARGVRCEALLDPFFKTYYCADGRPFYLVAMGHSGHVQRTLQVREIVLVLLATAPLFLLAAPLCAAPRRSRPKSGSAAASTGARPAGRSLTLPTPPTRGRGTLPARATSRSASRMVVVTLSRAASFFLSFVRSSVRSFFRLFVRSFLFVCLLFVRSFFLRAADARVRGRGAAHSAVWRTLAPEARLPRRLGARPGGI